MSRIAKAPVTVPNGVDIVLEVGRIIIKGKAGSLTLDYNPAVSVSVVDNILQVCWDRKNKNTTAQAGTVRANINNMVLGVSKGFEKKLTLVGVGYRAQVKEKILNLSLGFSNSIDYEVPLGITVDTPTQTEIVIRGIDKQQVGQVAAKIRYFRPPEPYKGKGIRYFEENIAKKEAKKK